MEKDFSRQTSQAPGFLLTPIKAIFITVVALCLSSIIAVSAYYIGRNSITQQRKKRIINLQSVRQNQSISVITITTVLNLPDHAILQLKKVVEVVSVSVENVNMCGNVIWIMIVPPDKGVFYINARTVNVEKSICALKNKFDNTSKRFDTLRI